MRVVIADDSEPIRYWLAAKLRLWGHEVVGQAENAKSAVDLCRKLRPDLAILDINMPSTDPKIPNGDVAAPIISSCGYARHLILATSQRQDAVVDLARRLGAPLLVKQYSPEMLRQQINRLSPKPSPKE